MALLDLFRFDAGSGPPLLPTLYFVLSLGYIIYLVVTRPGRTHALPRDSYVRSTSSSSHRPFSERGNPLASTIKGSFPARQHLLQEDERVLFSVMVEAAAKLNLLVFPRVSLSSVFMGLPETEFARNDLMGSSCISFLVVDAKNLTIVAGIQVEGKGEPTAAALAVRENKVLLFRGTKLPLIRLYNTNAYSETEVLSRFHDALGVQPLQ